jgi:hypothetical protein
MIRDLAIALHATIPITEAGRIEANPVQATYEYDY